MFFIYAGISLIFVSSILYFFLSNIIAIIGLLFFLSIIVIFFLIITFVAIEYYPKKRINFIKLSYLIICCSALYYLFFYPELKYNNVENYIKRYIYCEVEVVKSFPKANRSVELPQNKNCAYIQEPSIIIISDIFKVEAIIELLYLFSFIIFASLFWFLRKIYLKLSYYLLSLLNHPKTKRKK